MSGPSCGKGIAVPNAGQGVESMLETVLYLSREEKSIGGMFPTNPLQLAVILREVRGWVYFTGVPKPARRAAIFLPTTPVPRIPNLMSIPLDIP